MVGDHVSSLAPDERLDWLGSVPFFFVHAVGIFGLFLVQIQPVDLAVAFVRCATGIFIVTAFYHRYFSHQSYEMKRWVQFIAAILCTSTLQKSPVWWASHHRHHHQHSDQENDVHSWFLKGFWRGMWWSHVGWILCPKYHKTDEAKVRDWLKYPELRWLDRGLNHLWAPVALATTFFLIGGWSMLVVGFFTSTVLLWHDTFFINSLAHKLGRQRYKTGDQSRNSFILAFLTWGEGWHNNHHHKAGREMQAEPGVWQEMLFDWTHWILVLMSKVKLVTLRPS